MFCLFVKEEIDPPRPDLERDILVRLEMERVVQLTHSILERAMYVLSFVKVETDPPRSALERDIQLTRSTSEGAINVLPFWSG